MNQFEVLFRPRSRRDLIVLYRYIAKRSSLRVAGKYIQRIEKLCLSLATFPERDTAVPGRAPALRTMGFERRVTILFKVENDRVEILRILYGGQNLETVLEKLPGI